jgi:hypothetical protein
MRSDASVRATPSSTLQPGDELGEARDAERSQAALDAPEEGRALEAAELLPGVAAQGIGDRGERFRRRGDPRLPRLRRASAQLPDDQRRHVRGRDHHVRVAGGERASRHAVVLGLGGRLDDGEAAPRPHGVEPGGAVTAGSGQDDGHRVGSELRREGAEERGDRLARSPRLERVEAEPALAEDERRPGRDDVDAVRGGHRPIDDRLDRHLRERGEELRQDALVLGREVLHDDEREPGARLHGAEETLEGGEPTGRGAERDDGAANLHGRFRRLCTRNGNSPSRAF